MDFASHPQIVRMQNAEQSRADELISMVTVSQLFREQLAALNAIMDPDDHRVSTCRRHLSRVETRLNVSMRVRTSEAKNTILLRINQQVFPADGDANMTFDALSDKVEALSRNLYSDMSNIGFHSASIVEEHLRAISYLRIMLREQQIRDLLRRLNRKALSEFKRQNERSSFLNSRKAGILLPIQQLESAYEKAVKSKGKAEAQLASAKLQKQQPLPAIPDVSHDNYLLRIEFESHSASLAQTELCDTILAENRTRRVNLEALREEEQKVRDLSTDLDRCIEQELRRRSKGPTTTLSDASNFVSTRATVSDPLVKRDPATPIENGAHSPPPRKRQRRGRGNQTMLDTPSVAPLEQQLASVSNDARLDSNGSRVRSDATSCTPVQEMISITCEACSGVGLTVDPLLRYCRYCEDQFLHRSCREEIARLTYDNSPDNQDHLDDDMPANGARRNECLRCTREMPNEPLTGDEIVIIAVADALKNPPPTDPSMFTWAKFQRSEYALALWVGYSESGLDPGRQRAYVFFHDGTAHFAFGRGCGQQGQVDVDPDFLKPRVVRECFGIERTAGVIWWKEFAGLSYKDRVGFVKSALATRARNLGVPSTYDGNFANLGKLRKRVERAIQDEGEQSVWTCAQQGEWHDSSWFEPDFREQDLVASLEKARE